MRVRRAAGKADKRIFHRVAGKTKAINVGFSARGGIRL